MTVLGRDGIPGNTQSDVCVKYYTMQALNAKRMIEAEGLIPYTCVAMLSDFYEEQTADEQVSNFDFQVLIEAEAFSGFA